MWMLFASSYWEGISILCNYGLASDIHNFPTGWFIFFIPFWRRYLNRGILIFLAWHIACFCFLRPVLYFRFLSEVVQHRTPEWMFSSLNDRDFPYRLEDFGLVLFGRVIALCWACLVTSALGYCFIHRILIYLAWPTACFHIMRPGLHALFYHINHGNFMFLAWLIACFHISRPAPLLQIRSEVKRHSILVRLAWLIACLHITRPILHALSYHIHCGIFKFLAWLIACRHISRPALYLLIRFVTTYLLVLLIS